jgi:hypothetical protein
LPAENQFYRSVKLRMTRKDIYNYTPKHRGINVNWYAPILDGVNLLKRKDWKDSLDWVNATFTSSLNLSNPLEQRDLRDIDEELAILDSKYGILQDHLRKSDQDKPLLEHQSNSFFNHDTFLDNPILDQNDKLRSNAKNVHNVFVPLEDVKSMERHFERRKGFYGRTKFKDIKEEVKDERTGVKYVGLEYGRVAGDG